MQLYFGKILLFLWFRSEGPKRYLKGCLQTGADEVSYRPGQCEVEKMWEYSCENFRAEFIIVTEERDDDEILNID